MSAIPDPTPLHEADVRAMVRLLGEVAAKPGGHAEKKRRLMDGLCTIVCATAWVWGLAAEMDPEKMSNFGGFRHGQFDDSQVAEMLQIPPDSLKDGIAAPHVQEMPRPHDPQLSPSLPQSTQNDERRKSPDLATLGNVSGPHPCCLSYQPIDGGKYCAIALTREVGSPLFDAREALIVHTMLTEVPWLHEQNWPGERSPEVLKLAPRVRLVLELLLQSYSRKQIAAELGIRDNTVAGYTKEIYRQFHVQSHVELLRRFYQGNDSDTNLPASPQSGG
jgi:DNA-binding CsgD family transcriptional regulator